MVSLLVGTANIRKSCVVAAENASYPYYIRRGWGKILLLRFYGTCSRGHQTQLSKIPQKISKKLFHSLRNVLQSYQAKAKHKIRKQI
jgi:hypothetical protein